MIAKRLLVGLVAFGLPLLAIVVVEAPSSVHAQQQVPFFVPHGDYGTGTDTCRVCHAWHADEEVGVFPNGQILRVPNQDTAAEPHELDVCFACHDGSAAETNVLADLTAVDRASTHPILVPRNERALLCSECHAEHRSPEEDIKLLYRETTPGTFVFSPPQNPIGDTFCYGCHGGASTLPEPFGDHALFETSIHATSAAVVPPTVGTDLRCSACHEPHASDFPFLTSANEEDLCFQCHSSADPNTANGSNPAEIFGGPANDYDTSDGDGIQIYRHPVADSDQDGGARTVECASCHNSHLVNRTQTAADPAHARRMDLPGWSFGWDADSGLYNRSPNAAAFCGTCHVSPSTTSALMADGTDVPYDVNLVNDPGHDRFTLADYASSAHGVATQTGAGYLACPPGEPCDLACTACHDFHGSTNAFMLRESIVSPDYRPTTVVEATWDPGDGTTPQTATLRTGAAHGIGPGFIVEVSGVSPSAYDGTFTVLSATSNTLTYLLPLAEDRGVGAGGTVDPRGVGDARPHSATITGFDATDTAADRNRLQTFCLTCHLEQSPTHNQGQLCTTCHNHSSGL